MVNGSIRFITNDNSAIIKNVTPMGLLFYLFQFLQTSRLYEAVSALEVPTSWKHYVKRGYKSAAAPSVSLTLAPKLLLLLRSLLLRRRSVGAWWPMVGRHLE